MHGATAPWAAYLAAKLSEAAPVIVVVADDVAAGRFADDAAVFGVDAVALPAPETSPYAELAPDRAVVATRPTGMPAATDSTTSASCVTSADSAATGSSVPSPSTSAIA